MFHPLPHPAPTADPNRRRAGFSLVEVTLALGIAAFCLVLLFGLLPTGLNVIQKGADETIALNRASALLADVKATPLTDASGALVPASVRYGLDLTGVKSGGANLPEFLLDEQGNPLAANAGGEARFRVAYRIPAPDRTNQSKTRVYLRLSWPAPAAVSQAQGVVEIAVTVNRND